MTRFGLLLALATFAIGASVTTASADSIPGLRGHDHTGITVPDVKAATAFFTDVIGCSHAMSFGPFMDDKGTFMQDVVNVNPRAVIEEISMVRCGYGSNIELFQYNSPDQAKSEPEEQRLWRSSHRALCGRYRKGGGVFAREGRQDHAGTDPGQRRSRGRPVDPVFPDPVGNADGANQLSRRHGLRKGRQDHAVVHD